MVKEFAKLSEPGIEAAVLGGLMLKGDRFLTFEGLLGESLFTERKHRHVWRAIVRTWADAAPIDMANVSATMSNQGTLEQVGGQEYLAHLCNSALFGMDFGGYCSRLRRLAIRREIVDTCERVTRLAYDPEVSTNDLICRSESDILHISAQMGFAHKADGLANAVIDTLMLLENRLNKSQSRGIGTGFSELDEKTGGWVGGRLYFVAARPRMGKSTLAAQCARHAALQGWRTPYFSLEMTKEELITRLIAETCGMSSFLLENGDYDPAKYEQVMAASTWNSKADGLQIFDEAPISFQEIASTCRHLSREYPGQLGPVFIDHLQLLPSPGRKEYEELSEITRGAKLLAKELQIPVILLSQLSRGVDGRSDKRPILSDIRGSGTAEQDADCVIMLYRDAVYDEHTAFRHDAELIFRKNRGGAGGTVKLHFEETIPAFRSINKGVLLNKRPKPAEPKPHVSEAAIAQAFSESPESHDETGDAF